MKSDIRSDLPSDHRRDQTAAAGCLLLNSNASRSGLDRCLRRHGVGNLRDLKAKAPTPKHSAFKAYEPGYIHIDVKYLPQMADESSRRYLFVAIDRATRWVFVRVFKTKTAANARRFLRDLERACPLRIRTILTDEFTDRLFGLRKRAATGKHEFDQLCCDLSIEHRLAPPQHPQTNGMVERFNGRIEEVLQSHHFCSGEDLEATLHRYVLLYNQQLPQSALGSKTPLQAMKDWHKLKPELFKKQPYYLPGCDSCAVPSDCDAPSEVCLQVLAPTHLAPGGTPTEATLAHFLVSKYADYPPLNRQAQICSWQGMDLDRSTLAGWIEEAAGCRAERSGAASVPVLRRSGSGADWYRAGVFRIAQEAARVGRRLAVVGAEGGSVNRNKKIPARGSSAIRGRYFALMRVYPGSYALNGSAWGGWP